MWLIETSLTIASLPQDATLLTIKADRRQYETKYKSDFHAFKFV